MRLARLVLLVVALIVLWSARAASADPTSPGPPGGSLPEAAAAIDAARAKVAAGDTRGAIAGLESYLAAHPEDVGAARLLGDLEFRVPDYARAEKVWRQIIAAHPDDKETHNRLGSLFAVQDRTDEAVSEFKKSLPSHGGALGLVALHQRRGDIGQFVAAEQAAADQHPLDPAPWSELGLVRRTLRQYELALQAYQHVVGLRPDSCSARVDAANVLVDLGRVDPAMEHLRRCLKVDAAYYPAVVNLGEAFLEKEDVASARPYFDRALKINPDGNEALVDTGYCYDLQRDWRTAVVYYNRAIAADPFRPEAYIDLGYDYNERRLFPQAEAAYLKGLSVSPDNGRLHYMLAVTYNVQGKIALAREQYRLAIATAEPRVVNAAKSELALLPAGP
ncbi:MAG TPA: tetratricopeptide repeat protein [Candidatus Limnocylindria bacterium]|nr:tetratricopeptide repeat protein [Candidatus Limnocylindria bacterium]